MIGLVVVASLVVAGDARAESLLSVLSYNVRGLPALIAQDKPRSRAKAIATRARAYDVVLFQEDFEYHSILRRRMDGRIAVAGNGMVFDVRRLAGQILLAPIALMLPHFSLPYGAGLSAFVRPDLALRGGVERAPFRLCNGWLGDAFDCWASKGYLRVRLETAERAIVDVYSTHLDAGRGKRAAKTRRRQLRLLAAAIMKDSGDHAVIVGGDLNLRPERPRDQTAMMEFRAGLDLRDSGAGPELSAWKTRDYILYRSGPRTAIDVEHAGEALEFVEGGRALSDHPAVYARFRVRAIPESADGEAPQSGLEGAGPSAPVK